MEFYSVVLTSFALRVGVGRLWDLGCFVGDAYTVLRFFFLQIAILCTSILEQ